MFDFALIRARTVAARDQSTAANCATLDDENARLQAIAHHIGGSFGCNSAAASLRIVGGKEA